LPTSFFKGSKLTRHLAIALCLLAFCGALLPDQNVQAQTLPLPHDAYVWQRSWNQPVRDSVAKHAQTFSNLVVLAAEVSWKQQEPEVVRVAVEYPVLAAAKTPVGLALRIGPYSGPFAETNRVTLMLCSLAKGLVAEATAKGVKPSELQIDFDCAESKLEGYRTWVTAMRKAVAPVPLTITTLPTWLRQPTFGPLVAATDGFILQVHSLERPKSFDTPFTLCDPATARSAVEKAAPFGVPFRVALPTYGYLLAFATNGQFVGLSAEGPSRNWPVDAKLREVRSDPLAMAALTQEWSAHRPTNLRGIIWYRLPVEGEILNWRWPTLAAIVASRSPRESVRAESRRVGPGLVEICLVNDGELDLSSRLAVEVRWQNARLVAGDGLRGFEMVEVDASTAKLQSQSRPCELPAGDRQVLGWLRLNNDAEVKVELKKL
jgi:hypothetical protein